MSGQAKLLGGLLTAALALLGPASAQAVTPVALKADYELQGSYASAFPGGPDLTDIGTGNAFATETVMGTARQVLTFPQDNGLDMATSGAVNEEDYSVVMIFRLADVTGYRRILDFQDGTSDYGLYNHDGLVDIFDPNGFHRSAAAVFSPGTYVELALTNKGDPLSKSHVTVYANGVEVDALYADDGFKPFGGHIRFFKDDGSSEESAGAAACIRVYDGTLSPDQVAAIAADLSFCAAPATAGPGSGGAPDTTAPNTKLKKKPAKRTGDDTPTFKFTSTEAGSTFKCRIDRKKFKPCRSPFTTKRLDPGRHKFRVEAIDPAGNVDPTPAKFKFTVLP